MTRPKLLFILHLPPPVHGAAMMGKYIKESKLINGTFECDYFNLSTSKELGDIGRSGFLKLFVILKLYFKIFFAVLKKKYDLCYMTISSNGMSFFKDIVIVLILKVFGNRIIYHYHNKGISKRQNHIFYNLLYRLQFSNSRVILISPRLFNDVAKYLPREKVFFCANGIPVIQGVGPELIIKSKNSKAIPEILFLSNMMREKGVFTLLEACKLLYAKGIKFKMVFVGAWVDISEAEFQEFVWLNKLKERVFCVGNKYNEEKSAYCKSADVFVFPTFYRNEVFPLAVLEAMQYGLPVISTREAGIPDIVSENITGYLIGKNDVNALADKMQYLIENPEVRRRMGIAARRKFEEFYTLEIFERNFINILAKVINENSFNNNYIRHSVPAKKVLFLYKFLPQYRVDFFNRLRDALYKENIELELVYGKSKGKDALKNDEVDIEWAKYVPNKSIRIGNIKLIRQPCLKYVKGKNLVIVQLENKLLINYYLMVFRHFSIFKLGYWGHGRNMQLGVGNLRNRFKYLYMNKCDWWFAYTKGVKKNVLRHHFPEKKITVVQNAIDTCSLKECYDKINDSDLNKLKESLGITGYNTGIFCGGMYPEKRIDFIIETCKRIKTEIPDFQMIFIGSGIDAHKVIETSKTCDWVHYIGAKFGMERVIYFKISSIQIMPGLVGLGILDSFAMETPIITTTYPYHSPEIDYLENGINGIMTNDNIDEYSKMVIDILKTKKYIDLLEGCRLSSEKYTVEAMVTNFKNGILSCLEEQN